MRSKLLGAVVVIQFVVICALVLRLIQGRQPTAERERVETALTDIRGALSVGANYTQFQEKVQALAAAIANFEAQGGGGSDLARFGQSLKRYKDSLDLWNDELSYPGIYGRRPGGRFSYVPTQLGRIAKEQGVDLSNPEIPYKIFADELLQVLWTKADQAGSRINPQKAPALEPTQPKKKP